MLEAMAAECLVIGSDTPPVREVIEHGHNGLLTPFFDIEQLSDRVIHALRAPAEFDSMRHAARNTIHERYDFNTKSLPRLMALLSS
jgi:glycosyltransferase involved in cell wall biosynthesis